MEFTRTLATLRAARFCGMALEDGLMANGNLILKVSSIVFNRIP